MFRLARKGTIEYIESEELSELGFATHAFCTRLGGVSTGPYSSLNLGFLAGDRPDDVRRNLALVEMTFEIPEGRCFWSFLSFGSMFDFFSITALSDFPTIYNHYATFLRPNFGEVQMVLRKTR